jgi:MFS family permease
MLGVVSRMAEQDEVSSEQARAIAIVVLLGSLAGSLLLCGLAEWSREEPFKVDKADFSLFAAFIVVAGAIERFLEPVSRSIPPWGRSEQARADRSLYMASIALVLGVVVSAVFGLYFLEAIGVEFGQRLPAPGGEMRLTIEETGDKLLRGLDVFITSLIITGGTKPLHDTIKAIEKTKEAAEKAAGRAS